MKRFFSNTSFWNTPLADQAVIHPESDRLIALIRDRDPGGPFGINLHQWTIPVYEIDADTPRVSVHRRVHNEKDLQRVNSKWIGAGDRFGHGPGFGENVPMPISAQPDPEEDGHMAIVDWEQGLAWDMWGIRQREDGEWESNTGMIYPLNGPGVFDASLLNIQPNDSVHFHGPSRAAGVPVLAGLIMRNEIEEGRIEHKLAAALACTAFQKYGFPAIWTDGFLENGVPEGSVIQLDPSLDVEKMGLSRGAIVVARALQEYGACVVDVCGGTALYGEGLWDKPNETWEGLLDPFDLSQISMDHYRILKLENVQTGGCVRNLRLRDAWETNQF